MDNGEEIAEFIVADVLVNPQLLALTSQRDEQHLPPKHMSVLVELARHAPAIVSRAALLQAAWPRGYVDPAVLGNAISSLRKTFEALGVADVLETVPRRGYRLKHQVRVPERSATDTVQGSPYRGLQAFDVQDRPVFFGREAEIETIGVALEKQAALGQAFILILGASGSGKTSLLRAGLLPRFGQHAEQTQCARYVSLAHGGVNPWHAVVEALLSSPVSQGTQVSNDAIEFVQLLQSDPESGLEKLSVRLRGAEASDRRLFLGIDHLESLFTLAWTHEELESFLDFFHALARSGHVSIAAAMRNDRYADCMAFASLRTLMSGEGRYDLQPLTSRQIGRIIREPAVRAGLLFERHPQTGVGLDDVLHSEAVLHPEALPLLQFTLQLLFEHKRDRTLTHAAFEHLGGVTGCLARSAEEAYATLAADARREFDFVFQHLVHLTGAPAENDLTRRVAPLAEFAAPPRKAFIDAFVAARLFATHLEGGRAVISVTHEALLRHWRRVGEWLDENRETLRAYARLLTAARSWQDHERARTYLLGRGPLTEAERVVRHPAIRLGAAEQALVDASRRHLRVVRGLRLGAVVSLAALTIVAVSAALWANRERGVAQLQYVRAEQTTNYLVELFKLSDPSRRLNDATASEMLELGTRQVDASLSDRPTLQARVKTAIGMVYMNLGHRDLAQPLLEQAVSLGRSGKVDDPAIVVDSLNALGRLNYFSGDYARADVLYNDALTLLRKSAIDSPQRLAHTYNNLGELAAVRGQLAAALQNHREALNIRRAALGEKHLEVGWSLNNIAGVLRQQGDIVAAKQTYRQAIAIQEKALGEHDPDLALTLANFGLLLTEAGEYAEAEALQRRALAIRNESLGPMHPHTAHSLHNLAALLVSQRNYAAAEPIIRESIDRHRAIYGEDHQAIALGGNMLGTVLLETGRNDEALKAFETAYRSAEKTLGARHFTTAILHANAARALAAVGRHFEARDQAEQALATIRKALPPTHWRVAAVQNIFGGVLLDLKEYPRAEQELLQSWATLSQAQGVDAATRRTAAQRIEELYRIKGDVSRATEYRAAWQSLNEQK